MQLYALDRIILVHVHEPLCTYMYMYDCYSTVIMWNLRFCHGIQAMMSCVSHQYHWGSRERVHHREWSSAMTWWEATSMTSLFRETGRRCVSLPLPLFPPFSLACLITHAIITIIILSCIEDYYFYHWQYIEAFIYFSHHFITLPPPTWTNAAHRHGVLSMGTIITEWKDGATLCHQLVVRQWFYSLV